MVNFWNLERGSKKDRDAKKRKLKELNALPGTYESAKIGRKKNGKTPPIYKNLGAKHKEKGDR